MDEKDDSLVPPMRFLIPAVLLGSFGVFAFLASVFGL